MDGVETDERADAAASAPRPAEGPVDPAPPTRRRLRRPASTPRRRGSLALDLTLLGVVGVALVAALGATGAVLYKELYSPEAFVTRYLDLLSDGEAVDALSLPGVTVSTMEKSSSALPAEASEALLRRAALGSLSDYAVEGTTAADGITNVTVSYEVGAYRGETTFHVEQTGWVGIAPTWRFTESPLAVIDLTVHGSMEFSVNGFEIDKRQVSPEGLDADPQAPIALLVLSPGIYSVSVATPTSESPGVAVVSDTPGARIPVAVQAQPTAEFVSVVQEKVDAFLTQCATQEVLQPTGCPFGFYVQNRIDSLPSWSIVQQPTIVLEPDGANWKIAPTDGVAHIDVDIRSIFDGSVREVSEDVPFTIGGTVTILPDGSASIQVTSD